MSEDWIFAQAEISQLKQMLEGVAFPDLLAVTLLNGDMLLGGIFKHWKWNDRTFSLSFNTSIGKRFGFSHFIEIPIDLISSISVIPLDDSSIPHESPDDPEIQILKELMGSRADIDLRISPLDYPNPLASIICTHNTQVASSHSLTIQDYAEFALPEDAISPEGLVFEDDFLLYADWEFFTRQTSGAVSLAGGLPGLFEISKDMSKSSQQQVLQRLREHAVGEKVRRGVSPTMGEHFLQGCILVKEPPETTQIEGEECHLWAVIKVDDGEPCSVLVKIRMLKFPLEFINHVNSTLTFYGELLPVPLNVLGTISKKTLLARAIAYLCTD